MGKAGVLCSSTVQEHYAGEPCSSAGAPHRRNTVRHGHNAGVLCSRKPCSRGAVQQERCNLSTVQQRHHATPQHSNPLLSPEQEARQHGVRHSPTSTWEGPRETAHCTGGLAGAARACALSVNFAAIWVSRACVYMAHGGSTGGGTAATSLL